MSRRGWEEHERAVRRLADSYDAIPTGEPVRLAKRTTNLFRRREAIGHGLDVTGLDGVIEVIRDSADGPIAEVQGMCTYEELVNATLSYGLIPYVVPQLRTITLGGAVTGLGIESTSFRNGLPHESVLEMDVFTGAGEVVTTRPGEELFNAFPNSYGSLGYATRLRIRLESAPPYVALRHVRYDDAGLLAEAIEEIVDTRAYGGERVDGLDGVAFGPGEYHLTVARWTDDLEAGEPSDYTGQQVYYRSIRERETDLLTMHDYLWRWDTDWFWCSGAFGAQHPLMRRLWSMSAAYGVPLSVHMDADPASIAEMERLITSDRAGTWIWAHSGWYADPALLRRLFQAHPNLYADLSFRDSSRSWSPVEDAGFHRATDPPGPAAYRAGLVDGLFLNPDGYLDARAWGVRQAATTLASHPEAAGVLRDLSNRISQTSWSYQFSIAAATRQEAEMAMRVKKPHVLL
jgi:hypothetical protein